MRVRRLVALASVLVVTGAVAAVAPARGAARAGGPATRLCDAPAGSPTGATQHPELVETSGLAWSRRTADLLWAHNDSGDTPRVFALGRDGRDRGTVLIDGATAEDWEDIALQRGPGARTNRLWVGDIGDATAGRAEVVVYRLAEPDPPGPGATAHTTAEAIALRYEDGPHDAEAMIVDDRTGDLVIATKEPTGPAGVYVARASSLRPGATATLARAGDLRVATDPELTALAGSLGPFAALAPLVTGADATGKGRVAAVRSYGGVSLYPWPKGTRLADALTARPCAAPAPLDLTHPQGEAIALAPDGRAFATASEGAASPIVVVGAGSR